LVRVIGGEGSVSSKEEEKKVGRKKRCSKIRSVLRLPKDMPRLILFSYLNVLLLADVNLPFGDDELINHGIIVAKEGYYTDRFHCQY
jgi:hypothetical protein